VWVGPQGKIIDVATLARSTTHWDERIARARELARAAPSACEALTFYAALAEFQRSLFLTAGGTRHAESFADAVDVDGAVAAVPGFLGWLKRTAPAALAESAATMRMDGSEWRSLLQHILSLEETAGGEARAFVAEAVLQPFAEAAAIDRRGEGELRPQAPGVLTSRCPICSDLPAVGTLREEGQGARRTLVCGRCLTDWAYLRVVCASCGEDRFDALPVYTADAFPHVRIEACDTCKAYLKTIDLTRNGLAVPLVDDIASVSLDLWAVDQGYKRLRANLLRMAEPASTGIRRD